jgi:hypothetical protein
LREQIVTIGFAVVAGVARRAGRSRPARIIVRHGSALGEVRAGGKGGYR